MALVAGMALVGVARQVGVRGLMTGMRLRRDRGARQAGVGAVLLARRRADMRERWRRRLELSGCLRAGDQRRRRTVLLGLRNLVDRRRDAFLREAWVACGGEPAPRSSRRS